MKVPTEVWGWTKWWQWHSRPLPSWSRHTSGVDYVEGRPRMAALRKQWHSHLLHEIRGRVVNRVLRRGFPATIHLRFPTTPMVGSLVYVVGRLVVAREEHLYRQSLRHPTTDSVAPVQWRWPDREDDDPTFQIVWWDGRAVRQVKQNGWRARRVLMELQGQCEELDRWEHADDHDRRRLVDWLARTELTGDEE